MCSVHYVLLGTDHEIVFRSVVLKLLVWETAI
ncbi:hypothetical protein PsAD46_04884 [Pseudovibrio sp. Ad46]|nr:hypothetical protein PsAD46_04884 [Pseudovibrio sp. Ad46]